MKRLDQYLVEEGLISSRSKAKELIVSKQIMVNGKIETKPSHRVDCPKIEILGFYDYVGRGYFKLQGAIEKFNISLVDKVAIDVGASTGGFTQVMLEQGIRKVYAIDVGHDQLSEEIREYSNVINMEGINFKNVHQAMFDEKIDFISIDVSFISLTKILNTAYDILKKDGELIALIKPQFEINDKRINKNGIIRRKEAQLKVCKEIKEFAKNIGFEIKDICEASITGGDGNQEYLIYLKK